MIFVSKMDDGTTIRYRDGKRYLWILSILSPAVPGFVACILLMGGSHFWASASLFFYFIIIPILDMLIGEDYTNPPEEVVSQMATDSYYRILLYLSIPVYYFSFLASVHAIATLDLSVWTYLAIAGAVAVSSGGGLTVAHELGHKVNFSDRFAARLITTLTGYAHFNIEHNQGHHVMVATPEDPASSRLNESIYAFAFREIPMTAKRGWELETRRLSKKSYGFWSLRNELLQGYFASFVLWMCVLFIGGMKLLPFLIIHALGGWLQLTAANYVEHYGLKRSKDENGRYEPCEPHHSWNTNHIVSNLVLFHLQRHSDHHANPMRPYQALRNFDELPRLPSGYPGSFLLAYIPPLWFRIMNPKVMEWAEGDVSRINTG